MESPPAKLVKNTRKLEHAKLLVVNHADHKDGKRVVNLRKRAEKMETTTRGSLLKNHFETPALTWIVSVLLN